MEYKYTSKSVDDTLRLAENLESEKFPNMVICLEGELGSGKTVFTKGFATALGIEETITSPTFTIIKEYLNGELPLYKGGVTIIEWADNIKDKLPKERLEIKFRVIDENTRILLFEAYGEKYEELCNAVL